MEELSTSVNEILSLGISGIPFTGADIPGFFGRPTDELFILFYQLGVFYPFMRAHGHIEFYDREPYLQSDEVQKAIKESINLRYDLIHYIYTLAYQTSQWGTPLVRPMWLEFPKNQEVFNLTT